MADETYKPKRKPITDGDQGEAPSENQMKLEQMAQMREQVAQETGQNPGPRTPSEGESGSFAVEGNVPPAFQQARQRMQSNRMNMPVNQAPTNEGAEMRLTGSNKLEELLKAIQAKTSVYEPIQLPSMGRFYDGTNGPANGILHVRPMTGQEEEILATPRFVKKGQAINMIFQRCVQEQIDPNQLVTADRTYLLIFLRGISYTPQYDVEVRCTECETKFATVIDLNSLYVEQCPLDFDPASLSGTLPTTGLSYRYRLSMGGDETDIQAHRDRKMKGGFDTAGQADDTLIYRTAQLVEEIEGLTNKMELIQLIKRLPINDVAHLRNVVNDPPFGVDTEVSIPCPSCMADFTVDLPLEANFFFPRRKTTTQGTTPA